MRPTRRRRLRSGTGIEVGGGVISLLRGVETGIANSGGTTGRTDDARPDKLGLTTVEQEMQSRWMSARDSTSSCW